MENEPAQRPQQATIVGLPERTLEEATLYAYTWLDFIILRPAKFLAERDKNPAIYSSPVPFLLISLTLTTLGVWGSKENWIDNALLKPEISSLVGIGIIIFANYIVTVPIAAFTTRLLRVVPSHRTLFDAFCYASAILVFVPFWLGVVDYEASRTAHARNADLALGVAVILPIGIPYFLYLASAMARSQRARLGPFLSLFLLFTMLALGSVAGAAWALNYAISEPAPEGIWSSEPTLSSQAIRWRTLGVSNVELPVDSIRWLPMAAIRRGESAYVRIVYAASNGAVGDVHVRLRTFAGAQFHHILMANVGSKDANPSLVADLVSISCFDTPQVVYRIDAVSRYPHGTLCCASPDDVYALVAKSGMLVGNVDRDDWGAIVAKVTAVDKASMANDGRPFIE